jgi:hypothetical protein
VTQLTKTSPGKHVPLERFQEDIAQSLDKHFGQFLRASETTNSLGYRVYRVVAAGTASELPIEWIYYRVADQQGRQVVFAFTVEQELLPILAEADQSIVETLEFGEGTLSTAEKESAVKK